MYAIFLAISFGNLYAWPLKRVAVVMFAILLAIVYVYRNHMLCQKYEISLPSKFREDICSSVESGMSELRLSAA